LRRSDPITRREIVVNKLRIAGLIALALAPLALAVATAASASPAALASPGFVLTSPAFAPGGPIPKIYTCDGYNAANPLSPPLRWTAPPHGTRAFAIKVDNTGDQFRLWLGWGIRASARGLAAGQHPPHEESNSLGYPRYDGPCPQASGVSGVQHFRFRVYALDANIQPSLTGVFPAKHVLAVATLVGTYK
jgi:phosphatidylethanolamine-binding protein (PEBP) family uncharacterized protein